MSNRASRDIKEGIVEGLAFSSLFAAAAGGLAATQAHPLAVGAAYGVSALVLLTTGVMAQLSSRNEGGSYEPAHMDPEYRGADVNFLSSVGLFGGMANGGLAGLHAYAAEGISAPAACAAAFAVSGGAACVLGSKLLKQLAEPDEKTGQETYSRTSHGHTPKP